MGDGEPCRVAVVDRRELVRAGLRAMLAAQAECEVVAVVREPAELRTVRGSVDVVAFCPTPEDARALAAGIRALGAAPLPIDLMTVGSRPTGAPGSVPGDVDADTLGAAILHVAGGTPRLGQQAVDVAPAALPVRLSRCEQQVLALYAAGAKAQAVATQIGVSIDTVHTYVRRVRQKYERAGRPAASRVDLYHRAVEDGLLLEGPMVAALSAEVAMAC